MSIVPELSVRRGRAAVEFYKEAFGAVEVYRVGGTDEHEDVVSQLTVGGASFWVSDESPPNANFSPETLGGGTVRILLIVDDPRAAVERAIEAGATEVAPVTEQHHWLLGPQRAESNRMAIAIGQGNICQAAAIGVIHGESFSWWSVWMSSDRTQPFTLNVAVRIWPSSSEGQWKGIH